MRRGITRRTFIGAAAGTGWPGCSAWSRPREVFRCPSALRTRARFTRACWCAVPTRSSPSRCGKSARRGLRRHSLPPLLAHPRRQQRCHPASHADGAHHRRRALPGRGGPAPGLVRSRQPLRRRLGERGGRERLEGHHGLRPAGPRGVAAPPRRAAGREGAPALGGAAGSRRPLRLRLHADRHRQHQLPDLGSGGARDRRPGAGRAALRQEGARARRTPASPTSRRRTSCSSARASRRTA